MNKLTGLVYVSTVSRGVSDSDIEHILLKARERNRQKQITGLLLYCHGTFMQYLEGPEDSLTEVFNIVKNDRRHCNIIQLTRMPILEREFDHWSMAYSSVAKTVIDKLSQASWLEQDGHISKGRTLLSNFWKSNTAKKQASD